MYTRIALVLILSTVALSAADVKAHFAARPTQYSCDMVMSNERGEVKMHLVQDGERKRTEMKRGAQNVVMIVRPDQQKMLMVMPEKQMIMAMPYDAKKAQDDVELLSKDGGASIEAQGTETIHDVLCDKFATTASDGKKATLWIAQEQHTVQKWVTEDGKTTIEFSNYKIGPQDAVSFEPPAGYQIMAIPGGAPGAPPAK